MSYRKIQRKEDNDPRPAQTGLIIPGNYFINSIGSATDKVLVIDRDDVIDDLRTVTNMVHRYGD